MTWVVPKWSSLRTIGNSTLVRLTILIPIVGYLLLLNANISDFFRLHADLLPDACAKSSSCAQTYWMARLYLLYFGLTFCGVASSLYQIRCDPRIKAYDTPESYVTAVRSVVADKDILAYQATIDRLSPTTATSDFLIGQLSDPARAEQIKLGILGDLYRTLDSAFLTSRIAVSLLYGFGFLLVAYPSLQTLIRIIVRLAKDLGIY